MSDQPSFRAGRYLLLAFADVPKGREEAFNHWYDEDHIPKICSCPGFLGARRFVAIEGQPRFLAVYELATPDALTSPEFHAARGWGPFANDVSNFARGLYEQISHYEGGGR
jgi:hypothetical protein